MAEKEYIEREAAKKVLADDYAYAAAKLLDTVPTADVQEIVRCKDCKKFCPNLSFCTGNCIGEYGYCQITNMNVPLDFYCGNAEKMDKT